MTTDRQQALRDSLLTMYKGEVWSLKSEFFCSPSTIFQEATRTGIAKSQKKKCKI
jgi:hypothetical protein